MKRLKFSELPVEDRLLLSFAGTFEPKTALERELEPFLDVLEAHADAWMPDVVVGARQRKYSREALWKSLEEQRDENSTHMGLYRTVLPAVEVALRLWFPPLPPKLHVWVDVQPLSLFEQTERCRKFVEMVRAWAIRYPAPHISAHSMADRELADSPNFGRDDETTSRDGFDKIYEVCWLNVFGPRLVAAVGRERMLSTPAHRVEELPDGSILLVIRPTPTDFSSEEARQVQARALVHLRPELRFDAVLRTLRERSATLAPVEPRFHPDVAPLLSRVVDTVPISQRQHKIAELNAYHPPEAEEWLPAAAALPSDVTDPKAALEHYALQAEYLVALLHTEAPSVFEATPESLTAVDYQFWHESFPEVFERHNIDARAVPAVGAYLGQVLVRQLGGEWIPRKKLEEAQVRIGERVWLPFLRAHRYMRSRQALLDYSLTQFYREAERHRAR
jgi:hypothetical protein